MADPRVQNLAKVLVRYCLKAKQGETITVHGSTAAEPLIHSCYEELLRAGAYPLVLMEPEGSAESFYRLAKPHHLDSLPPIRKAIAEKAQGSIRIKSETNTRNLSSVSPAKQARLQKAARPLKTTLMKQKWVLTLFPTAAYAQDAEMSLKDFEDFVYAATFADQPNPIHAWKALHRRQDKLIAKLKGAKEVRIVSDNTDLSMSIQGRTFINSSGRRNMPSGEVFTGPIEDSAEGYIQYDFPVCVQGREVEGIRLVFKKGKVVEATAKKNQSFLRAMLDSDPGARRLGELGIGTNMNIQRFTKNILYDEKIGGTVHLAVGNSYPETGGLNKSAVHWDMIKDLRKGGTLYVDGKVFQKDGKFR
jgi:aminopeptidase